MAYNNLLETALNKTLKMEPFKTDNYRPPRFRLSSSPFCAYRFIFKWYDFVKTGYADFWDYSADFYTSVGTAIHSNLQKWIPLMNPGLYLGNWKCPKCGKVIEAALGPKWCSDCKKWMIYDEFTFVEKPGIAGHCDGVMLTNTALVERLGIDKTNTDIMDKYIRKCKKPVEAIIVEYKSAGSYKAKRITNPTPNNKAQALMYVPCANNKMKKLGLNVHLVGAVVKYLSRDNPNSASTDFYLPVKDDSLLIFNKDIVRSVYKAIKTKDTAPIKDNGLPCRSKYKELYADCGYRESCDSLRKSLKSMFKDVRKDIKKDFLHLKALGENR